jgi:hypothetical protein
MNELDLLTRLRDEIPLAEPSAAVEGIVLAGLRGEGIAGPVGLDALFSGPSGASRPSRPGATAVHASSGRRAHSRTRRRLCLAAAGVAGVVAAAAGIAAVGKGPQPTPPPPPIAWSGRVTVMPQDSGYPSVGRAHTEAQLVDYATRVAAVTPGRAPAPHDWVYIETEEANSTAGHGAFMFGPPNERIVGLQWIRVDWKEYAGLSRSIPASLPPGTKVRGQISISPGGGGTLGGWKSVSYAYLSSLPTDPAKLAAVILAANTPGMPWHTGPDNVTIFTAIQTLLTGQTDGVWIPPKLAVTMYRLLQVLPGVRFDSATDLAGRTGLGFYMVIGYYKQELVINPVTYTFMGEETVAVQAHQIVGTDGTFNIRKGQVLGWIALLQEAIVRHVGQLP